MRFIPHTDDDVREMLAAVGVYGVMAYAVNLRAHEIGVRMALGASTGQVRREVLRQGLLLTGAGVLLGTAAGAAVTPFVVGLLYGVDPYDPSTLLGVGRCIDRA